MSKSPRTSGGKKVAAELRPSNRISSLDELVARITPENIHPEVDWGPEVGQERVEWRPATAPRVRRSGSPK